MRDAYVDLLLDEETSASIVAEIARRVLGKEYIDWEPEAIWLELNDQGANLPQINRDKLQAVITLVNTQTFYWDAPVFENTAIAFSSMPVLPTAIQEATPAQLRWAIEEAGRILDERAIEKLRFDYEPVLYAAASLHRAGFHVAPTKLEFAQSSLNDMNRGQDRSLRNRVRERWEPISMFPVKDLEELQLEETPEDTQLALLVAVELYVRKLAHRLAADTAKIR